VQCTPDLRQARLAVATQLLIAVPLNLLLFGLGTVLYLFYQQHPADLSPAMKLDGIYPFFVAQQLPPGVSGIVVAALLAATMSTISSCNCSVSDIITQDFYKRFNPAAADRSILLFGRFTTLASGLAGILTALWMANATMGSIWDLATLVTNLIGNGIVGLFTLGMITSRAHQTGALIGVLSGMATVFWLQQNTTVTFWLFTAVGTFVTVTIGYIASLALPGRVPPLEGLTIFSLPKRTSPTT
jgi:Na+/proline symporter